jgi:regulatory protein YycH of two-component signal transduction system YycFG
VEAKLYASDEEKQTKHRRRRVSKKKHQVIKPNSMIEEHDERKEALNKYRGSNIIFSSSDIPERQCISITYEV